MSASDPQPSHRATGEILLACEHVSKRHGGTEVLRDVSLTLRSGEILGLLGPNGAGKTTLVDIVTGQQRAGGGSVRIRGRVLTGAPVRRARRARLARTFQHPDLSPDVTIREHLLAGELATPPGTPPSPLAAVRAALTGTLRTGTAGPDQEIRRLTGELGLGDPGRRCADLTLGERRLVELARALLRQPSVLLLDEPFAGVDAAGVEAVRRALTRLVRRDCGVLVVDHNVDVVASLAHRIVLLDQGRVVFEGTREECLASPEVRAVYFDEASREGRSGRS